MVLGCKCIAFQVIWTSDFSQSVHRKGPPNRNLYRAAARLQVQKICKYGGIVRGIVFLKMEYLRIYTYYVFFTHNLFLVLVLYSRMAFLQESALKEALKSFSMLPKA